MMMGGYVWMYNRLSEEVRNQIVFSKRPGKEHPMARYEGFWPHTVVLPKGFVKFGGALPLPCDIIYERDVAVQLRDKVTIYIDVFRPVTEEKVPVVFHSTTFGKNGSYSLILDGKCLDNRMLSGFQSFEAFDPAYWCAQNYAIAVADMRGVHSSQGNTVYFGCQDAEDNYDIIEFLGEQEWCNGKVAMSGNSWLGMTQWWVAALQPPHLTCIIPWEGHGDLYRDEYVRGGIPNTQGIRPYLSYGDGLAEDLGAMIQKYPYINEYWEDKRARFEDIKIPIYAVSSYPNYTHSHGTVEGFRLAGTDRKWLRINNTFEWPDMYCEKYKEDAKRFLDRYCKNLNNGWENTPKVRVSVLNPDGEDIVDRPEADYPIPDQELRKLYLHYSDMTMDENWHDDPGKVRYISDDEAGMVQFCYTFPEDTEITGIIKMKLWVEVDGYDDMDIFAKIHSTDLNGKVRVHVNSYLPQYNFEGPDAMLRVSLREIDFEKSTPYEPFHTYKYPQKLAKGEIVPIEIGFWPNGMLYKKGDHLILTITGSRQISHPTPFVAWYAAEGFAAPKYVNFNKGTHIIHMDGGYDSYLQIPVVKR